MILIPFWKKKSISENTKMRGSPSPEVIETGVLAAM